MADSSDDIQDAEFFDIPVPESEINMNIPEKYAFKSETRRLLEIVTRSLYTGKEVCARGMALWRGPRHVWGGALRVGGGEVMGGGIEVRNFPQFPAISRNFPHFTTISRNFLQFFRNCFLLAPIAWLLVRCVSP